MIYFTGIISRTNKKKGTELKNILSKLIIIKNYKQFWDENTWRQAT